MTIAHMENSSSQQTALKGVTPIPPVPHAVASLGATDVELTPSINGAGGARQPDCALPARRAETLRFVSHMLIWLPREARTEKDKAIRAISLEESDAARAWYLDLDTAAQTDLAIGLFGEGYRVLNLACTCQSLASGGYPIMTIIAPVLRQDKFGQNMVYRPMTIRRLGAPSEHHVTCCFSKQSRRGNSARHTLKDPDLDARAATTFLVGTPTSLSSRIFADQFGDTAEQIEHPGRPTLCSLLMYLIDEASLNILGRNLKIQQITSSIAAVAEHVVRPNVSLLDLLELFPHQIEERPTQLLQRVANEGKLPAGDLAIGYCLLLVEAIEILQNSSTSLRYLNLKSLAGTSSEQLELELTSTITIDIKVRISQAMGHQVCGPYLLILEAGQNPKHGPTWVRGYACSILSFSSPVPVASDVERNGINNYMLPSLFSLRGTGMNVTMRKPVKNIRAPSGKHCNPDYVVNFDGGLRREDRRIVEAGNITTEEYDNSKRATRPIMNEYAYVKVLSGSCRPNPFALEQLLQWLVKPDDSMDLFISTD